MSAIKDATKEPVTVGGTGDTIIATIGCFGFRYLCFNFNVATQNLDNFDVFGTANPAAAQQDFTPTSWTALPAGGRLTAASDTNLAATTAGAAGYFEMNVKGLSSVVVKASAAGDSAVVNSFWTLSDEER